MPMRIAIASDHAALALKSALVDYVRQQGHDITDLGPHDESSVDYPDYGYKLAAAIAANAQWRERAEILQSVAGVGAATTLTLIADLPELEVLAKTERDRQLINLQRSFRLTGSPFILPLDTPKDRVVILQNAMTKVFKDPEFPKYFKKMVGDDPELVFPEVMDKAVKELKRPPEVVELLKKIAGADPLPVR